MPKTKFQSQSPPQLTTRNYFKDTKFTSLNATSTRTPVAPRKPPIGALLLNQLEYYNQIVYLKKKFVKSLESQCHKKREIYKIWSHWFIRVLSRNKYNWSLLTPIELELDETKTDHITRHMIENGIDVAIANRAYLSLIEDFNKLSDQSAENHFKLLHNNDQMKAVMSKIEISNNGCTSISTSMLTKGLNENNIYYLSLQGYYFSIKIPKDKYLFLKELYTGPPELEKFYLFEHCFNYYILDGKSLQWSIPRKVFHSLLKYNLQGELFASPINHFHNTYYSLFEIDRQYQSSGNYLNLINQSPQYIRSGLYEVNPPFIEEIFSETAQQIVSLLTSCSRPLAFLYIMPGWENLNGYDILTKSLYFCGQFKLEKYQHSYFQASNNKYIPACFQTVVILICNTAYREIYNTVQLLRNVEDNFTFMATGDKIDTIAAIGANDKIEINAVLQSSSSSKLRSKSKYPENYTSLSQWRTSL